MMSTYYNDYELEKFKSVTNKELNELLQEVRKIDDRYYLQENLHITKKLFRKPVECLYYTLIFKYNGIECQIVNFAQDNKYSINMGVTASYIFTYFFGLLTGLNKHK